MAKDNKDRDIFDRNVSFDKTLIDIKKYSLKKKKKIAFNFDLFGLLLKYKKSLLFSTVVILAVSAYILNQKNTKKEEENEEMRKVNLPSIEAKSKGGELINGDKVEEKGEKIKKIVQVAKELENKNNLTGAMEILKESEFFTNSPEILIYSGYLHLKMHDHNSAVNSFFNSLKYEKSSDAYYGLYRAYTELNEDDIARIYLKKYKQLEKKK